MNRITLGSLIFLLIHVVVSGREIILLPNLVGCISVDKELREIEAEFVKDQSRESGEYEVYTCCGGIKLYVQLNKGQNGNILSKDWLARDSQNRLLKIEMDEQQVPSTPGGSGITEPIIRIKVKQDDKNVACFHFYKKR